MTPEAQRIAIAEACGFTRDEVSDCWRKGGRTFFIEDPHHLQQLPDYLTDLNAMHEAEKALPKDMKTDYVRHLNKGDFANYRLAFATAAQRAEAFLKTLNLWTTHQNERE